MEADKVYQFGNILAIEVPRNVSLIVLDTNDNEVITFNNLSDFDEWLNSNDFPRHGILTSFELLIAFQ